MLVSYATGLIVLSGLLVAWVGVQRAWRGVFPEAAADPDALAGRGCCQGARCAAGCERGLRDRSGPGREEDA